MLVRFAGIYDAKIRKSIEENEGRCAKQNNRTENKKQRERRPGHLRRRCTRGYCLCLNTLGAVSEFQGILDGRLSGLGFQESLNLLAVGRALSLRRNPNVSSGWLLAGCCWLACRDSRRMSASDLPDFSSISTGKRTPPFSRSDRYRMAGCSDAAPLGDQ